jgi:hypothetical protein
MDSQVSEEKDKFTNDEIKDLKKLINELHENEHVEIFKIIKNDTDKFTENRNGIFINMSKLNINTLIKLQNFVNFCNENKKSFQSNKDKMETIKNLVSEENENNSNNDNDSNDNVNTDFEYKNYQQYYTYDKNPEINFNEVESSLLKESIHILESEKNLKKKKKYTGVKGRIMKKTRENILINNINVTNSNIKPIKLPENIVNKTTNNENENENENDDEYEDESNDYISDDNET